MASEQQVKETEQPKQQQEVEDKSWDARRFPLLLRVVVVFVLIIVMTAIGAIIGYSVIGGGDWQDVFNPSTWRHITDFWLT